MLLPFRNNKKNPLQAAGAVTIAKVDPKLVLNAALLTPIDSASGAASKEELVHAAKPPSLLNAGCNEGTDLEMEPRPRATAEEALRWVGSSRGYPWGSWKR